MSAPIKLSTPGLKIHNKYTLQLFDTDGQLTQEAFAYNQASSRRYNMVCLAGVFPGETYKKYYEEGMNGVHLGTGTGTIDIENREELFARAFSAKISWEPVGDYTFTDMHYRASATFPPTTSYVADLTEIGLGTYTYYKLFSHALLVDAEDNPIVVKKTSTNILVVTIDTFFTAILPKQPFNFLYNPPNMSYLAGADKLLPFPGSKRFFFSPAYAPDKDVDNIAKNCSPCDGYIYKWTASGTGSTFPYPMKAINCRNDANENNIGFAHSIVFSGFGTIPLPNESIIPAYNYNDIVVGTGNGSTKNWLPAVNEVVSAKVYVNGELTDASFQNFDPRRSPLWNKCIKVEYFNSSDYSQVYATRDIPSISVHDNIMDCIAIPMSNMIAAKYIDDYYYTDPDFAPCCYGTPALFPDGEVLGTRVIYYDVAGITLDHFRIGRLKGTRGTGVYSLQYSDDCTTWETAVSTSEYYVTHYFEAITAKYWCLTGGIISGSFSGSGFSITPSEEAYTRVGYDQKAIVAGNSAEFDFGKCGINFTTAPADGAVITMDATLNLPYKDNNLILIASYEAEVPDPGEAK